MKSMHRLLSAVLVCLMLISTLSVAVYAEMPQKLFELDLTNFAKSTTAGSSGAANIGTSKTAVITTYSTGSSGSNITVDLGYSTGIDGEDYPYLRCFHKNWNWVSCGTKFHIGDLAWEGSSSTFSFWYDSDPTEEHNTDGRAIFDYTVTYDVDGEEVKKSASLYQLSNENNTNYTWNFPGYNTNGTFNMNDSREWNHIAFTNPRPDKDGKKAIDLYINGVLAKTATIEVPEGATVKSAVIYFGRAADGSSASYCATDVRIGDFEVYGDVLNAEQIAGVYGETRGHYGFESPNTIIEATEEINVDTEVIEVSMMNDIDEEEMGAVTLKRKSDGTEIAADVKIDGTKVMVEPKEYLNFGTDYIIDFPALYCGDVEFTTPSSGIDPGYPLVVGNQVRFTIGGDGESERSLTIIAVGFDAEGKLCGAVSKDIKVQYEVMDYLEKEGLKDWDSMKVMVWENCDGYKMPLIETMEF